MICLDENTHSLSNFCPEVLSDSSLSGGIHVSATPNQNKVSLLDNTSLKGV
ncbi:hypothetical protein THF1D04_330001 [Vibrio owensii]|uniref:Uncharacterized protein n=1 Tax=Vibrio owensii TaxID=696485 RepID=A0AAU9Q7H3_9VIBR|nr:hypothetical protein THF1D04_330001 [Vibrio owensii]